MIDRYPYSFDFGHEAHVCREVSCFRGWLSIPNIHKRGRTYYYNIETGYPVCPLVASCEMVRDNHPEIHYRTLKTVRQLLKFNIRLKAQRMKARTYCQHI